MYMCYGMMRRGRSTINAISKETQSKVTTSADENKETYIQLASILFLARTAISTAQLNLHFDVRYKIFKMKQMRSTLPSTLRVLATRFHCGLTCNNRK
jgi:hypothetical protein